ncbi:MAG: ATP-binding cassette domain-containing protein, partial [Myxococcota bacterium]|nr:ATP-binding cassette domain-containing protein [Myxococcota bacterium]
MNLLSVQNLSIRYLGSERFAVDAVSLSIAPGETYGLVGESGSGKSTVLHAILRLLPAPGVITDGSVFFEGNNLFML